MSSKIDDPLEQLAALRPSQEWVDGEWAPSARVRVRGRILSTGRRSLVWRSRRALNPVVLSAAAVVALICGIALVAVRSTHAPGGPGGPGQRRLIASQDTTAVGSDQYARRTMVTYRIAADGTATRTAEGSVWAAPDGALWMDGTLSAAGCSHYPAPSAADFQTPTQAFFDQLPTTATPLEAFMRAHVDGSSSQDEALFVATGDMLRDTDLLASAPLRAAAVSVLSGISGISLHAGATDYLGRPALRVDWVNQALRPNEVSSLYFDPATYQLLEERSGPTGASRSYDGPSPAYSAHESDATSSPDELADPSDVTVMTSESVVGSVPASVLQCPPG